MNLIENSIPSKKKIENSNTKKNLRYCYFIPSKCTFSPDDSQVHSHMTETFTKFTHSSKTNNYQVPLAFKTLCLSLSLSQSQGRNFNEKISKNGKEREKAGWNHINNRRGLSFSNFWYVFLHRLIIFLFSFIVIFIIYSLLCFWEEKKKT